MLPKFGKNRVLLASYIIYCVSILCMAPGHWNANNVVHASSLDYRRMPRIPQIVTVPLGSWAGISQASHIHEAARIFQGLTSYFYVFRDSPSTSFCREIRRTPSLFYKKRRVFINVFCVETVEIREKTVNPGILYQLLCFKNAVDWELSPAS